MQSTEVIFNDSFNSERIEIDSVALLGEWLLMLELPRIRLRILTSISELLQMYTTHFAQIVILVGLFNVLKEESKLICFFTYQVQNQTYQTEKEVANELFQDLMNNKLQ